MYMYAAKTETSEMKYNKQTFILYLKNELVWQRL